ncbi:MAG: hypothetical protein HDR28_06005 [Lachnospiraceae bacterium]|nr:hypothetical protein [Lachnospiraceae bacterium]
MLKNNPNNQNALRVQRILNGEIGCGTYNLRMCYFNASVKEHDSIEACLKEMEEKLSPEVKAEPFMQECMEEFKEKLAIYNQFFRELSRQEKEGLNGK